MPLEICCFTLPSALLAAAAGASRIELCISRSLGGTTPSLSTLLSLKSQLPTSTPINVMIRPRGGNFIYSVPELDEMYQSLLQFKDHADGFVFGILTPDGRVNTAANRNFVEYVRPKPCTFHKAFDETRNMNEALEDVIESGFCSILTSGGGKNVMEGTMMLRKLVAATRGKIEIIAGGGVRSGNVESLMKETGVRWVHSSAIIEQVESDVEGEIEMPRRKINLVDGEDEKCPNLGEIKALLKCALANDKTFP